MLLSDKRDFKVWLSQAICHAGLARPGLAEEIRHITDMKLLNALKNREQILFNFFCPLRQLVINFQYIRVFSIAPEALLCRRPELVF